MPNAASLRRPSLNIRVTALPWPKTLAYPNAPCIESYTNTDYTIIMAREITQRYLDDMWEKIEDLEKQLIAEPNNVGLAALLHGLIDSYQSKQDLYRQQEWKK